MFNFDGRLGAIGRGPELPEALLQHPRSAQFDVETEAPVRGPERPLRRGRGSARPASASARSSRRRAHAYVGYADKAASEKKVLRDAFKPGDAWFRTGDLLRQDADGYFYFVDRIGDTFRWKGENVSTSEVAERAGGRAGGARRPTSTASRSATSTAAPAWPGWWWRPTSTPTTSAPVDPALPAYARPVFLRLLPRIEMTGTFKHKKAQLEQDGFDPAKCAAGGLYFREPGGGFVRLTPEVYAAILAGGYRL